MGAIWAVLSTEPSLTIIISFRLTPGNFLGRLSMTFDKVFCQMNFLNQLYLLIYPISPIKVILIAFAIFAWSRAILKFRARLMNQKELFFWSLLWLIIIIFTLIPGKTSFLAQLLGMGRGFDAMIFIAVIALFYAVYRLYIKANEVEREITDLVRSIALRLDVKQKKQIKRQPRKAQ